MEAIRAISNRVELVRQPSVVRNLATTSNLRLLDSEVDTLELLMDQTQARYPNQTLPPDTPVMYGVLWAEMVAKFGLPAFTDALSKVIRSSKFFPDPMDIEAQCAATKREQYEASNAARYIREHDNAKAQWVRERAEDRMAEAK